MNDLREAIPLATATNLQRCSINGVSGENTNYRVRTSMNESFRNDKSLLKPTKKVMTAQMEKKIKY